MNLGKNSYKFIESKRLVGIHGSLDLFYTQNSKVIKGDIKISNGFYFFNSKDPTNISIFI